MTSLTRSGDEAAASRSIPALLVSLAKLQVVGSGFFLLAELFETDGSLKGKNEVTKYEYHSVKKSLEQSINEIKKTISFTNEIKNNKILRDKLNKIV